MKDKFLNKSNIITLVIGIPSLVLMSLPWFGYSTPTKPINFFGYILSFLFLKISLIKIIFGGSLIFLFMNIISKTNNTQVVKGKVNDLISADDIEIFIHSEGEQIRLFIDSGEVPKLRIWLRVINKTLDEVSLDRIRWHLHIGQFLKKEVTPLSGKLKAKEAKNRILIEVSLSDAESKSLRDIGKDTPKGQLYGGISFIVDGKIYEKSFNYDDVHYLVDKKMIEKDLNLSKDQLWAILILLHQKDCAYLRRDLLDDYQEKYGKSMADFNILESELKKSKLIDVHSGTYSEYWVLTSMGIEVASKIHKEITDSKSPK